MIDRLRAHSYLAIPLLIACGALVVHRGMLDASLFGFDCYAKTGSLAANLVRRVGFQFLHKIKSLLIREIGAAQIKIVKHLKVPSLG